MRVTIVGRDFPPAPSGIGDHTDHLAAELARRGVVVTVLCSAPAEQRASFSVRPEIERWDRRGVQGIARAVAASGPDVVIWQYNPFNLGRRGVALAAAPRLARLLARTAPLIVFAHELWFPWGREGARGFVWAVTQRLQFRGVRRRARRVIVTTGARAHALRRSAPARIPVGTNIEPRPPARDPRATLGIPADAFVVVHLGATGPGRLLAPLFEALRGLRARGIDARILFAGDTGPLSLPPDVASAIHTTGRIARADLSAALQAGDVFVHADPAGPSAGRRTSLVAALAHALPIVSYRGPDAATELRAGHDLVLAGPDPAELTDALAALAADPDERRRLGRNAYKTYEATFAWPRIGEAVMRVLTDRGR